MYRVYTDSSKQRKILRKDLATILATILRDLIHFLTMRTMGKSFLCFKCKIHKEKIMKILTHPLQACHWN